MKNPIKFIAPAMAAAGIAGALLLAPIASADTDPLIPNGTDPHSSQSPIAFSNAASISSIPALGSLSAVGCTARGRDVSCSSFSICAGVYGVSTAL